MPFGFLSPSDDVIAGSRGLVQLCRAWLPVLKYFSDLSALLGPLHRVLAVGTSTEGNLKCIFVHNARQERPPAGCSDPVNRLTGLMTAESPTDIGILKES